MPRILAHRTGAVRQDLLPIYLGDWEGRRWSDAGMHR